MPRGRALRLGGAIPGAIPSYAVTLVWVSLMIVLPLAALAARPWHDGPFWLCHLLANRRALAALRLSFGAAAIAALGASAVGLLFAWVLVRVRPRGVWLLDALIDLPFALPTAVAGITLTALYAPGGWLGAPLAAIGVHIAYTPLGVVLAMLFVGMPFATRTIQPVLQTLAAAQEEAAATLGASPGQIARLVVLPAIWPAAATGFGLAFARAVGEYGSVIFIAGNRPMVSEIAPLLVVIRLQEFDYDGAAAIGLLMLVASAGCLTAIAALRQRLPAMRGLNGA